MPRDPLQPINARPTIRMDGTEYPLLSANIERMVMREETGGLSSLELGFVEGEGPPSPYARADIQMELILLPPPRGAPGARGRR